MILMSAAISSTEAAKWPYKGALTQDPYFNMTEAEAMDFNATTDPMARVLINATAALRKQEAVDSEDSVGGAIGGILGVCTGLAIWYLPAKKFYDERKKAQ